MGYLLRGVLIGLLFGLPVGAVGTMTVQRTWNNGIKAGLFTGLGSFTAATSIIKKKIGKFGFRYRNPIFGTVLCLFGVAVLLRLLFA